MKKTTGYFPRAFRAPSYFRAISLIFSLVVTTAVMNADLVSADGGQLVVDTTLNATWASDANLFNTLEVQSGNSATFVNTVISDSNGQIGTYALTSADFHSQGQMDWYGAEAFINYLNTTHYLGYSSWRLPTTVNAAASSTDTPAPSSSELAELIIAGLGGPYGDTVVNTHNSNFGLFSNFQAWLYWSGTNATNPTGAWDFNALPGEDSQDNDAKATNFFDVLPLMNGEVATATAPEPGSAWMLSAGLLGVSGFAMRRRRRAGL